MSSTDKYIRIGTQPDQPRANPGFEHINRYWDPVNEIFTVKLLPGEYYVSNHGEMITTVLGSCISACIRDRVFGIGGMNHFMLPDYVEGASGAWEETSVSATTRYGNFAMERLINDILKQGGLRENLEAKLFGGGRVLDLNINVGGRNAEFATTYLRDEGVKLLICDVGGRYPRKVNYYPASGKVRMKKLVLQHNTTIIQREKKYMNNIEHQSQGNDIELF
jgi:chemotaxis protein CheD